jgi:hypothetical protein
MEYNNYDILAMKKTRYGKSIFCFFPELRRYKAPLSSRDFENNLIVKTIFFLFHRENQSIFLTENQSILLLLYVDIYNQSILLCFHLKKLLNCNYMTSLKSYENITSFKLYMGPYLNKFIMQLVAALKIIILSF